jgi:hypothetical protein
MPADFDQSQRGPDESAVLPQTQTITQETQLVMIGFNPHLTPRQFGAGVPNLEPLPAKRLRD